MILSNKSIEEAIENGLLAIEPFDAANLKEASYTFTLQDELVLHPGDFTVGITKEKITRYFCNYLLLLKRLQVYRNTMQYSRLVCQMSHTLPFLYQANVTCPYQLGAVVTP